jgi:8-oxo-dGTP pyrophosphatase MutT (NUDIX family)
MWANLPELVRRKAWEPKSLSMRCDAHLDVAPEFAYGRHRGPAPCFAHHAAVLIGLVSNTNGSWSIPLTVRAKNLADHAGQISLPGGRSEAGETTWQTATREFSEELGCSLDYILPVAQLHPVFVYASRHVVLPMVAVCTRHVEFKPNPDEVAELIFLPIEELIDANAIRIESMQRGTAHFEVPGFWVGEHFVWGATAMILAELRSIVRELHNGNDHQGKQKPWISN